MNAMRAKALLVLFMMASAFAGAVAWKPDKYLADTRPKVDLETLFPKQFGGWTVDERMPVQLISPDQAAVLNAIYNQTLSRTYISAKGQRIMLSVAYGGDQSDATRAHRPEVCYPAQGFQIIRSARSRIVLEAANSIPVRRLVAKAGGRVEPIIYWVTVGASVAVSGTEQKLAQLAYSSRGIVPDGMLIRVSSIDSDTDSAFERQEAFVRELSKEVSRDVRAQLFGLAVSD